MHLGDQRRAVLLQPLDHVHLPQRAVGVELAAHHPRHERVELGLSARRRQAGPAQVVVELEVGIVDPDRVVQPEGHPEGPLAQRGDQVEPLLNDPADLGVAGRRARRATACPRAGRAPAPRRRASASSGSRATGRPRPCRRATASPLLTLFPRRRHVPVCPKPPLPRSDSPRPSSGHQLEGHLLDPDEHELGDAVAPAHRVVVLGIVVHQDDLQLTPVARVDQPRGVEAGDAVAQRPGRCGAARGRRSPPGWPRPPPWGPAARPPRQASTTSVRATRSAPASPSRA